MSISGMMRTGVLNGTTLDDTIIGGGTQIMRGMGGNNTYVYNSLRDGGDRIFDFDSGDKIDVSQLLANGTNYSAGNNLEDFIKIRPLGSNTIVGIDPDGEGPSRGFLNFIRLQGVSDLGLDSFVTEVSALP